MTHLLIAAKRCKNDYNIISFCRSCLKWYQGRTWKCTLITVSTYFLGPVFHRRRLLRLVYRLCIFLVQFDYKTILNTCLMFYSELVRRDFNVHGALEGSPRGVHGIG